MKFLKRKRVENAREPHGFWGKKTVRAMNQSHSDLTDWGLSFLDLKRDDTILDIGCGGGKTLKKLLSKTKENVYGVDHAATAVAESLRFNRRALKKGRLFIFQAGVSDLPFASDSFTKVTAVETVYFWPDLVSDFKEVKRVMKEGGRLMITTEARSDSPNKEKWMEIQHQIGMNIPSAPSLAKALKEAGFHKIEAHVRGDWLTVTAEK